jgi:hypothetical protein
MGKYTVAIVLGCLYVAMSSWIVSDQGRAHRDLLLARRKSAAEVKVNTAAPPSEVRNEPSQTAATETAAYPAAKAVPALPKEEKRHEPLVAARREPHSPKAARSVAARTEPARPEPADALSAEFAKAIGTDVANVKAVRIDPIWQQPAAKKKWTVANLSTSDEKHLGADLHEMVMHFLPRYGKSAAQERVEKAAIPLVAACDRKDIEYKFFVLDSGAVNAFSLPGGYVYVTRGLLDWISEDEDYTLQFALAHEICHVDRKHALHCLEDSDFKQLPSGTLQLFYLFIIPRGYLPEQLDFDADAWAFRQLRRLRYTDRECMTFMRKLKGYSEKDDGEVERSKALPRAGNKEALFDNHYRAHPPTFRRLAKLEALLDQISPKSQ